MYSNQARKWCRPLGAHARQHVLPPLHDGEQRPSDGLVEPRRVGRDGYGRVHAAVAVHGRVGAGAALHRRHVLHLRRDGAERGQFAAPDVRPRGDERDGPDAAVRGGLFGAMAIPVCAADCDLQMVGQITSSDDNWAIDGTVLIVSIDSTFSTIAPG